MRLIDAPDRSNGISIAGASTFDRFDVRDVRDVTVFERKADDAASATSRQVLNDFCHDVTAAHTINSQATLPGVDQIVRAARQARC